MVPLLFSCFLCQHGWSIYFASSPWFFSGLHNPDLLVLGIRVILKMQFNLFAVYSFVCFFDFPLYSSNDLGFLIWNSFIEWCIELLFIALQEMLCFLSCGYLLLCPVLYRSLRAEFVFFIWWTVRIGVVTNALTVMFMSIIQNLFYNTVIVSLSSEFS